VLVIYLLADLAWRKWVDRSKPSKISGSPLTHR